MQLQSYALIEDIRGAAVSSFSGGVVEVLCVFLFWLFFPESVFWGVFALFLKNFFITILSGYYIYSACVGGVKKEGFYTFFLEGSRLLFEGGKVSIFKSFPYFLLTVLIMINYKADILMLAYFNVDALILGAFSVGVIIAEYLWVFSDIFKDVQISRSSRGGAAADSAFSSRVALFVTLVVYIFYALFGRFFVVFFFGDEFSSSFDFSLLVLAANFFMVPCKILGSYLISSGGIKGYLLAMFISVFLNVTINGCLIPDYGVYGAVISSVISYSFAGLCVVFVFSYRTGEKLADVLFFNLTDLRNIIFLFRSKLIR
ncbi:hypothetical protein Y017_02390 [Alcanivorax sp. 97CO-5]|nr:hypothetical protein Y017_02390 [Alcanivorax sp. 97CO-5]PKG03054.1 hypothetical protein Y019_02360 [Alcanivorax sp. 97CO-6]